jgi:TP901 family phage tail tape measure protein
MATTLGEAVVKITASLAPLKKSLKKAEALTAKAASKMASGITKGVTGALSKIARTAQRMAEIISVALVGAFGLATREAIKFQKQLAFINTMLDDQTEPLMEGFKTDLSEMAKEFGQSTATLSKGLFDILSASIPAEKAIDVLRVSATAAVGGLTDTGIAADVLTTIINSYGMEAEDAATISDKLFATVKRGKTTFPELAQSLGRVTSTASTAGLSLDELLATVATLTRSGIQTTEAVTSINGVLRAFLSPTDEAVMAAEEFGLVLSSNTLKTEGFLGAVKRLNSAEAEQLISIIPNIRAFKALAGALNNVEGLQEDVGLISEQSAGKTAEAFSKMADTTSFKLGQMKEGVKAAGRGFAEPLLEPIDRLLDKLNAGLDGLEEFFRSNGVLISQWGDLVNMKVDEAIAVFADLLSTIQDDGWLAGLEKIGIAIVDALSVALEFIKPVAIEIGELMYRGFQQGFGKTTLGKAVGLNAPPAAAKLNPNLLQRDLSGLSPEIAREAAFVQQFQTPEVLRRLDRIADNTDNGFRGGE